MKRDTIETGRPQSGRDPAASSGNKGPRDAEILVLLWEAFKNRAGEIDHLLDLSLSIVASADDFPQKAELESALKRALSLVRS